MLFIFLGWALGYINILNAVLFIYFLNLVSCGIVSLLSYFGFFFFLWGEFLFSWCSIAVKYEVKLEDGTLVARTTEDGVEFLVNEGNSIL